MENKQTRLMTGLALVLLVLVLVIRLVDPPAEDEQDPSSSESVADLIDIQPQDVITLHLVTSEGTLSAERSEAGWVILAPFQARGDDIALDDLVLLVDRLQVEPPLTAADPARYGLDQPQAKLTLGRSDGSETVLSVGVDAPVGGKGYLQINGDDVQVSTTQPRATLTRPFEIYRDRKVTSVAASAVTEMQWTLHGSADPSADSWAVVQRDGHWWMQDGRRAKDGAMNALLGQVGALKFETFGSPTTKSEVPHARLRWVDEQGPREMLFLVPDPLGMYVLSPEGRSGTIGGFDALELAASDVLEDRLAPISPSSLARVTVHWEGSERTWRVEQNAWTVDGQPDPEQGRIPMELATSAMGDRRAPVPSPTVVTAWVELDNGYEVIRVNIGQEVDGGRVVQSTQGEPPYLAPASSLDLVRGALQ